MRRLGVCIAAVVIIAACSGAWAGVSRIPERPVNLKARAAETSMDGFTLTISPSSLRLPSGDQGTVTFMGQASSALLSPVEDVLFTWPNPKRTIPISGTVDRPDFITENQATMEWTYEDVTGYSESAVVPLTVLGGVYAMPVPAPDGIWTTTIPEVWPGDYVAIAITIEAQ